MKRLIHLLSLVAAVILLLCGYTGIGLAAAFVWLFFRIRQAEENIHEQHAVTHNLLLILTSDLTPPEKQAGADSYINQLNEARDKKRKDWLFKLQNFGLKEDDPRWAR